MLNIERRSPNDEVSEGHTSAFDIQHSIFEIDFDKQPTSRTVCCHLPAASCPPNKRILP
jgi:hypothetical protein